MNGRMKFAVSLCLHIFVAICSSETSDDNVRTFDGHQVLSIVARDQKQFDLLQDLQLSKGKWKGNNKGLDFWTDPSLMRPTDVMVAPERQDDFKALLSDNQIEFKVKIPNVQSLISAESEENLQRRSLSARSEAASTLRWDYYPRFHEIQTFLLEQVNRSDIATVEVIGRTYEGRNIYAVKISNSPNNKKNILIDANIHAREWITSATATWILNEFTQNPAKYADSHLNGIDYYIIPMLNPDGYEFTHMGDRLWRKTRSNNCGSTCFGTDPNRNFPFLYGCKMTSEHPCDSIFRGNGSLSERETKALVDYVKLLKDSNRKITAYISFHAYGQYWLLPWGFARNAYPEDYQDQLAMGLKARDAIKAEFGTEYEVGTGADLMYGVGGASDDYFKSIGIKYTVTIEMRDTGEHGFSLPPAQIVDNAKEIMAGLSKVAEQVRLEA